MLNQAKKEALLASSDMAAVEGSVVVDVPVAALWNCFALPRLWPQWNRCFFWVYNRTLTPGRSLIWCFEPIEPQYLYKMPAMARIVEYEEQRKVTWEVSVLPGFYALHTYYLEDAGGGKTRFGSWEKAMGASFRLLKPFWLAHFTFVNRSSLEGAQHLERIYRREGTLHPRHLQHKRDPQGAP